MSNDKIQSYFLYLKKLMIMKRDDGTYHYWPMKTNPVQA